MVDIVDDGRPDLEPAGPGADEGHPLTAQVHRVIPLGRMEDRPAEGLQSGGEIGGDHRPVQESDTGDDRRRGAHLGPSVAAAQCHRPPGGVVVPLGALGLQPPPVHIRLDLVVRHDFPEVRMQFRLARVVGREVPPDVFEGVGVVVTGHVDRQPG